MLLGRSRLVIAAALLLAACTERNPDIAFYAPPPGLTPDRALTILGSKGDTFFLQSNEFHFVWAVDGLPVAEAAYRWSEPLLLTADTPHRVSLGYDWGPVAGNVDIEVSGRPGTTLVIKAEDVERQSIARLWLEESATGRVVGDKHLVRLSYLQTQPIPMMTPNIVVHGR